MTSVQDPIYRIIFDQEGKQYEIYAKYLSDDGLMGFIQVEALIFQESSSTIVVDPSEEKLRAEFKDVKRCYIPMHAVLRIDEVQKEGAARIIESNENISNISHFPRADQRDETGK